MVTQRFAKMSPEVPYVITDGRVIISTAGARQQLTATVTTAKAVVITAISTNTGVVFVGGVTVVAGTITQQGTPLYAGETITIPIDDLSKVYLDVTINGNGVTYTRIV